MARAVHVDNVEKRKINLLDNNEQVIEGNRFRRERREVWEGVFSQLSHQISLLVKEI